MYSAWIRRRLTERAGEYEQPLEPGLLSLLTPVWDRSPLGSFQALAESVIAQNENGACEWVIADNGCENAKLRAYLKKLSGYSWVKVRRYETNAGILRGLRLCLENAGGRYVLPVDGDDLLYPDALRIVTSWVRREGYPALLYTDEDKIIGSGVYQPYLKPDWDPVLLLNSAYIAHLGVMDRETALAVGVYSDPETEGSADWDAFVRFLLAGHSGVHIPEVVYSWRVHRRSTADDAAAKPYIQLSQKAVLQRFLAAQPEPQRYRVEHNPLLSGGAHWRYARRHEEGSPLASVTLRHSSTGAVEQTRLSFRAQAHPRELEAMARELAEREGFIHLLGEDVEINNPHWLWDALCLFELHPDAVMVGAKMQNRRGLITDAGRCFGFAGVCGSPNRGRPVSDPGYFAQIWKQRSVSAVSTQFAVVRADFLLALIGSLPKEATLAFLGAWAGAHAWRTGRRIVYSPFLSGISDVNWDELTEEAERNSFASRNAELIPDRRYYPRAFSLEAPFALGDG